MKVQKSSDPPVQTSRKAKVGQEGQINSIYQVGQIKLGLWRGSYSNEDTAILVVDPNL